ncbi:MAG TPA: hypothetical protein VEU94_19300 [Terriglobales bacterium]|nr:hypothetical protein [Terriglobales bacterium]
MRDIAGIGFTVESWKLLRLFGGHLASSLAEKGVDEQATAHPYATMDAPNRQLNADPFQGLPPSKNMLVDAVDQGTVEIKEESWSGARYLHFQAPGLVGLRATG